jgi:predicted dehydrogenase
MKLRVGLVGIGHAWENRHRPALRALSDRFEVRAVCEPVAHRAAIVARDFGATAVDGYSALTQREDIDAVLVLSSQWFGALPILAACEAGKSIYCAAPLDFEPHLAQSIQERLERSGVAFVAELPQRHAAATLRLKELIATRLGNPRLIFCHQRIPAETPGARPANKPPVLPMHEMVQLVDWCRYVVSRPPTSVLGLSHSAPSGEEKDYEMMSLDFAGPSGETGSGVTCQISSGRYMPILWHEAVSYRPPAALQVACENGIAFIDLPSTLVWFDSAGRHMESLDSERPVGEQLLNQFHRAVTSLVRNTSGLEDAFQAMSIVQQARESHRTGCRMPLPAKPSEAPADSKEAS